MKVNGSGSIPVLAWVFGVLFFGCITVRGADFSFRSGESLLAEGSEYEQQSRQRILEANTLRKQIANLHMVKRKGTNKAHEKKTQMSISTLTDRMETLRHEGADLRLRAGRVKADALDHFRKGMVDRWAEWIKNQQPLGLGGQAPKMASQAHNPKIASADPAIISRQAAIVAAGVKAQPEEVSSLLAATLKEQDAPSDLDLGVFQLSRERKLIAHIEVANGGAGSSNVPINEIHQWHLIVSDTEGKPFDGVFKVLGHMPGHVHGLPTQPAVTKQLAPGVYLVEGLKFQMRGWWVMEFETGTDSIRFNVVL